MLHNRRKNDQQPKLSELEELSRLTGGLAHEIKNPLSIIKVNLKLISEELNSKDANPARAARKIAVVQKETDRLEKILEDFLRYIKKTELHPVPVDINRLVTDMTDFYSPQAVSRAITLRTSLCDEPLICKADADSLKQVLLNLFINAQQAMPDGGELMIRTQKNCSNAVIIVSDTGKGIEPENTDKIFDAYYSTKSGGSGLGLSTSRKIIKAHHGSIKVDSVPQKGTSFTIQLPIEEKIV
ncbi:MAG: ATP-binding protein [Phycisphaerae bacterium]|jgi:signal transduction histidine kinase